MANLFSSTAPAQRRVLNVVRDYADEGVTTDVIGDVLNVSRGCVQEAIRGLMAAGLVEVKNEVRLTSRGVRRIRRVYRPSADAKEAPAPAPEPRKGSRTYSLDARARVLKYLAATPNGLTVSQVGKIGVGPTTARQILNDLVVEGIASRSTTVNGPARAWIFFMGENYLEDRILELLKERETVSIDELGRELRYDQALIFQGLDALVEKELADYKYAERKTPNGLTIRERRYFWTEIDKEDEEEEL